MNSTSATDNSSNSNATLSTATTISSTTDSLPNATEASQAIEDTPAPPGVGIDNTTVAAIAGGVGAFCLVAIVVIIICACRANKSKEKRPEDVTIERAPNAYDAPQLDYGVLPTAEQPTARPPINNIYVTSSDLSSGGSTKNAYGVGGLRLPPAPSSGGGSDTDAYGTLNISH